MKRGHEQYDLRSRPLIAVLAGVVAVLILALAGLSVLHRHYTGPEREVSLPEQPRPMTAAEIDDMQEARRQHLESYGWVDRDGDIAHIPIDRAMELVLRTEEEEGR